MDSTYAPQSPDFSAFLPPQPPQPPQGTPPVPQQYQLPPDQPYQPSTSSSYAPQSPTFPPFTRSPPLQDRDLGPHYTYSDQPLGLGSAFPQYGTPAQYMPPIPTGPPYQAPPTKGERSHATYDGTHDAPPALRTMPRGPRVKAEPSTQPPAAPTKAPPPSIEIKTKFPVARIKRIMQADEEVGKVAQVTPVAVNKALELFMTALVLGAAERARERGGKRITAGHLKSVVEADEQFDFLGEIVARVPDAGEERKRKGGRDSESEDEAQVEKKAKKGKGRRKKSDDE